MNFVFLEGNTDSRISSPGNAEFECPPGGTFGLHLKAISP